MTAGNQPTQASINQTAGSLAVQLRELMAQITNFSSYITAAGGAEFLAGLGFTDADAGTIVSTYGNLAQLAGIYAGAAAAAFDYETNSELLWGGQ